MRTAMVGVQGERTVDRLRGLLSGRGDIVEKRMMGSLCFMAKGHMCCAVDGRGGLLVRVGAEAHAAALAEPHTGPMRMGERVMSGFVRVAPEGCRSEAALAAWVGRGLAFVDTLPPR